MQPLFQIGDRVKYNSLFYGEATGKVIQIIKGPELGVIYDVKLDKPNLAFAGEYQQFPESLLEEAIPDSPE